MHASPDKIMTKFLYKRMISPHFSYATNGPVLL